MVHYKLHYFDMRGLGETARVLFHAAGQQFEDIRIKQEDWPALKKTFATGKVPLLEVDGHKIPESYAIYRFLANKFGFAGKDEYEKALVDSTADFFRDSTSDMCPYIMVLIGFAEGDKDTLYKEKFLPSVDRTVPYLESVIKKSGSGFVVPSGVTWADFFIAERLSTAMGLAPEVAKKHPFIPEYVKRVHEHPKVKGYISSRKPSPV